MRRRTYYPEHKSRKFLKRWIFLGVPLLFLSFVAVCSLFFSMRVLHTEAMAPNLLAGDRLIFSTYKFIKYLPWTSLDKRPLPFSRGHVVLVDMFNEEEHELLYSVMDGVLRFVSAQRISLIEQRENIFIKRIIGLPGDEITMTNYLVRVRAKDSAFSLTEFELTEQRYTTSIPQASITWDSSLPFSGDMDRIVLGDNEFFLLSDDRSNTNDSRTWGPVTINNISGRALFRYWPFTRLGRP